MCLRCYIHVDSLLVKVGSGSAGTHRKVNVRAPDGQRRCANAHAIWLFCLVDSVMLLKLHVIGDRLDAVDGTRHPNRALDIGA